MNTIALVILVVLLAYPAYRLTWYAVGCILFAVNETLNWRYHRAHPGLPGRVFNRGDRSEHF